MKRSILAVAVFLLCGASALTAAAAPLKVLTYNVGLLRVFGHDFVPTVKQRSTVVPREIARFALEQSVDILVLQELWRKGQAEAVAAALEPLGYDVVWPRRCTLVGRESGLLLAVKRPLRIDASSFVRFGKSTFMDSLAHKGVLETVIEIPSAGTKFALVATHTVAIDTDQGVPIESAQVDAYAVQARTVLAGLETISDRGALPALVVGDFNVGPGYADAGYRMIADAPGIREAGAVAAPGQPLVTWDPANPLVRYGAYPNEPAAKIDHVFVRDGTTGRWIVTNAAVVLDGPVAGLALVPSRGAAPVPTPLSDHYGFFAELELDTVP
jgi:endonuclease/exonuclease/phosphatase family metal-dependent hydrolase